MLRYLAGATLMLAAISAVALARRRHEHAPVAWYLGIIAVARLAGWSLALLPSGGTVWIARSALWMTGSFALPWLVVGAMSPEARKGMRHARVVSAVASWLAVSGCLALAYPAIAAEEPMRLFYTALECASLLACCAFVISWLRRGAPIARLRASTLAERTTLSLVGAYFALLFLGAWPRGLWGAAWRPQQAGLVALYGGLAIVQGAAWWRVRSAP